MSFNMTATFLYTAVGHQNLRETEWKIYNCVLEKLSDTWGADKRNTRPQFFLSSHN